MFQNLLTSYGLNKGPKCDSNQILSFSHGYEMKIKKGKSLKREEN